MDIWNRNLETIQVGFPELYERIRERKDSFAGSDFDNIENLQTLTEVGAVVIHTKDNRQIRLNSAYDPETEAKIWADGVEPPDADNIMIFGLGNGSFSKDLVHRRAEQSRVMVYEPSAQLFLFCLRHYDLSDFFKTEGVRVIVEGLNEDMYSGVMEEMLNLDNFESKLFYVIPFAGDLFPESRTRFIDGFIDGVGRMMSNRNTIRRFIHLSPFNQLHNLKYLKDNTVVPKLSQVWEKDVPVIIAGAGPSLKKEIDVIRNSRDKVFLFAVDSALPYLFSENVIPDAYICIEADKPMDFFADPRAEQVPLFAKIDTTHKLLDVHKGLKVFGFDEGLPRVVYEEYGVPASQYRYGGNGATSFFAICKELGVKNVILVGQDMAYGLDHETHVGGRDEGFIEDQRFVYKNNKGQIVQSRQDWHRFIKWYENAIPVCHFDHVINTSENGVKIAGTEFMALQSAINRYGRNHSVAFDLIHSAERTFQWGKSFDTTDFYHLCEREVKQVNQIIYKDPYSEERKKFRIYELLRLYETADMEDDFVKSQKEGLHKIMEYIQTCLNEKERG